MARLSSGLAIHTLTRKGSPRPLSPPTTYGYFDLLRWSGSLDEGHADLGEAALEPAGHAESARRASAPCSTSTQHPRMSWLARALDLSPRP